MNKALFLDRDGVINRNFGHVHKINKFVFRKGIFELLDFFKKKHYLIIIITNQAGIAKGLYSFDDFKLLNEWMLEKFVQRGIKVDRVYFCPHQDKDNCSCRKPKPGMILNAINDFNIDSTKSLFIGDKMTDEKASTSAGIKFFYNISNFNSLKKLLIYLKTKDPNQLNN